MWEKWKQRSVAFIVQFVSGALKWAQNLAGLKLVSNKLGVVWQPHWLSALYWIFTAKFTPPHTLQYEISCWHTETGHQHTSTKTQHMLVYAGFSSRGVSGHCSEWIIVNSTRLVASYLATFIRKCIMTIKFEEICLHSYSLLVFLLYYFFKIQKYHNHTN